jgi:vacuolar-type H+-ATPase subunit H
MSDTPSISAINRVLEAEGKSKEDVDACRQQAKEIVESGRNQARQITSRADDRISTVHARADLSIDRRLAELRQEMASLAEEPALDNKARDRLQGAVE